jgi:hypothetical protein
VPGRQANNPYIPMKTILSRIKRLWKNKLYDMWPFILFPILIVLLCGMVHIWRESANKPPRILKENTGITIDSLMPCPCNIPVGEVVDGK